MRWWMFEGLIWLFLIIVGAALIELLVKNGKKIFRQPIFLLIVVFLVLSWGVVFYGSFIEPRILVVNQTSFEVESITQPIRVALLSDIHIGPYKGVGWVEEVVKKTNEQKPDLILLLGDYVMGQQGKIEQLEQFKQLKASLGVYAVLGNHDYDTGRSEEIRQALESFGIKVLVNSSESIVLPDGSVLWLAGTGDLWNDVDLTKTLAGRTADEEVILLSHNPDAVLFLETGVADLVLSGHTHGGQIKLPWFGPVAFVPTELGQDYEEGWFTVSGIKLFITSGLGEMGPRARLFNPPEIVILELK